MKVQAIQFPDRPAPSLEQRAEPGSRDSAVRSRLGTITELAPPTPAELSRMAESMNRTAELFGSTLQFSLMEGENRILVKVIDKESGEVVREIPPEELIRAMRHIEEAVGVLLDRKV